MRRLIRPTLLILLCAVALGCEEDHSTRNSLETKPVVMQSGGASILKLNVDVTVKVTPKPDSLNLRSGDDSMDIWLVPGTSSVDEGVAKIPVVIKEEFKEFKATSSMEMPIAGTPAKHLMSSGEEADDGDSGTAQVVVFKVGDKVFVACTHGESLTEGAKKWMLEVVGTATTP